MTVFGIANNEILSICGSVRRRFEGCGLGRDRAADITAARERSESLLRCSYVMI